MTQVYKVIEEKEHEVYERLETCVFDIAIRSIQTTQKSNVSDVLLTITTPSGSNILNRVSMTNDATGEYSYKYNFLSNAEYGRYDILYEARDTDGTISSEKSSLFLFRYDIIDRIRQYSGITKTSVSNEDVASIAMEAFNEVLDEVFIYHHNESLQCDPDKGVLFDGTNKIVRTKTGNIADYDFDGNVYGEADLSTSRDIIGYWIDSDYAKHDIHVSVNDNITGRITITQDDDTTAIPNNHNGVYVTYWSEWKSFNIRIFKDAVAYLASHNIILRLTELHRATAADLPSNQKKIELNLRRFEEKYQNLIEQISEPKCEGV